MDQTADDEGTGQTTGFYDTDQTTDDECLEQTTNGMGVEQTAEDQVAKILKDLDEQYHYTHDIRFPPRIVRGHRHHVAEIIRDIIPKLQNSGDRIWRVVHCQMNSPKKPSLVGTRKIAVFDHDDADAKQIAWSRLERGYSVFFEALSCKIHTGMTRIVLETMSLQDFSTAMRRNTWKHERLLHGSDTSDTVYNIPLWVPLGTLSHSVQWWGNDFTKYYMLSEDVWNRFLQECLFEPKPDFVREGQRILQFQISKRISLYSCGKKVVQLLAKIQRGGRLYDKSINDGIHLILFIAVLNMYILCEIARNDPGKSIRFKVVYRRPDENDLDGYKMFQDSDVRQYADMDTTNIPMGANFPSQQVCANCGLRISLTSQRRLTQTTADSPSSKPVPVCF